MDGALSCVVGGHTMCKMQDGNWKVFGQNDRGQLGLGHTTGTTTNPPSGCMHTGVWHYLRFACNPTPVVNPALSDVEHCVLPTSESSFCRKTDGSWLVFGGNDVGQLGLGDNVDRSTPTENAALAGEVYRSSYFYSFMIVPLLFRLSYHPLLG